jgi:hypothetical protein
MRVAPDGGRSRGPLLQDSDHSVQGDVLDSLERVLTASVPWVLTVRVPGVQTARAPGVLTVGY